jgi:hypothetical protein
MWRHTAAAAAALAAVTAASFATEALARRLGTGGRR